jgi:predicted Zn-dependent peptidase
VRDPARRRAYYAEYYAAHRLAIGIMGDSPQRLRAAADYPEDTA